MQNIPAFRFANPLFELLWDVMKNDATLFMRTDQVETALRLLMPVPDAWAVAPSGNFPNYAAGA